MIRLYLSPGTRHSFVPHRGSVGSAYTLGGVDTSNWLLPSSVLVDTNGLKRGKLFQNWEYLHQTFKKTRGFGELGTSSVTWGEAWQGMNVQERCLMFERAVFTGAQLQEDISEDSGSWIQVDTEVLGETQ